MAAAQLGQGSGKKAKGLVLFFMPDPSYTSCLGVTLAARLLLTQWT